MLQRVLVGLVRVFGQIGADPADDDTLRLQKTLLVSYAVMTSIAGVIWGGVYFAFDESLSGLIPLCYAVLSVLSLLIFTFTRRFALFRFIQLTLILMLPWLLMMTLGGFTNSSAVILWSILAPLGALLFDEPKRAARWFVAYLIFVGVSILVHPALRPNNNLPPGVVLAFFGMNIVAISLIVFTLFYWFVRQRNDLQDKADNLLLSLFPKDIAAILKRESRVIADHYDEASILFADVVNFTPMSADLTPVELVQLLDEVFSAFDLLSEKHGVEKIKTIGDCYMVAAGIPRRRRDHASTLVSMALEMRDLVARHTFHGHQLHFRYGINSGPVVAGVIGRRNSSMICGAMR
jgi:guanylate cyclase